MEAISDVTDSFAKAFGHVVDPEHAHVDDEKSRIGVKTQLTQNLGPIPTSRHENPVSTASFRENPQVENVSFVSSQKFTSSGEHQGEASMQRNFSSNTAFEGEKGCYSAIKRSGITSSSSQEGIVDSSHRKSQSQFSQASKDGYSQYPFFENSSFANPQLASFVKAASPLSTRLSQSSIQPIPGMHSNDFTPAPQSIGRNSVTANDSEDADISAQYPSIFGKEDPFAKFARKNGPEQLQDTTQLTSHHPTEFPSFLSLETESMSRFDDTHREEPNTDPATTEGESSGRRSGGPADDGRQHKPMKESKDSMLSTPHGTHSNTFGDQNSRRNLSGDSSNQDLFVSEHASPFQRPTSNESPTCKDGPSPQEDKLELVPASPTSGEYIAEFKFSDTSPKQGFSGDKSGQIHRGGSLNLLETPQPAPRSRRMSTGTYGIAPKPMNYAPGVLGGARLPREQAKSRDFGDVNKVIKSTGFAAEGGNFDASKAGAGFEAKRLRSKSERSERRRSSMAFPSSVEDSQDCLIHSRKQSTDTEKRRLSIGEKLKQVFFVGSKHEGVQN